MRQQQPQLGPRCVTGLAKVGEAARCRAHRASVGKKSISVDKSGPAYKQRCRMAANALQQNRSLHVPAGFDSALISYLLTTLVVQV